MKRAKIKETIARALCYWEEGATCHDAYCHDRCSARIPDARFFERAALALAAAAENDRG